MKFFLKILKFYENWKFWNLKKKSGFLDSDDNARGSRKTITVVCSISDVQLKTPRKLFKLPVNSSAAVNSLSVKNVKQQHFYFFKKALRKYILRYNNSIYHKFKLKYRCFVYALSMIVSSLYRLYPTNFKIFQNFIKFSKLIFIFKISKFSIISWNFQIKKKIKISKISNSQKNSKFS